MRNRLIDAQRRADLDIILHSLVGVGLSTRATLQSPCTGTQQYEEHRCGKDEQRKVGHGPVSQKATSPGDHQYGAQ